MTIACRETTYPRVLLCGSNWSKTSNGGAVKSVVYAINGVKTISRLIANRFYNATFEIPESWLTPKPAPDNHIKNLFLNWQDLNELNLIDGEENGFDEESAQVINSVLPFENCAAHVGDKGWGNGLWNDLQGRIYVTDLTPDEITARVEKQGLGKAAEVFERASVKFGGHGRWEKKTLNVLDAPSWGDFISIKNLEFYYRSFDNKTVVIVFLRADKFEKEIDLILDSFKWSAIT